MKRKFLKIICKYHARPIYKFFNKKKLIRHRRLIYINSLIHEYELPIVELVPIARHDKNCSIIKLQHNYQITIHRPIKDSKRRYFTLERKYADKNNTIRTEEIIDFMSVEQDIRPVLNSYMHIVKKLR